MAMLTRNSYVKITLVVVLGLLVLGLLGFGTMGGCSMRFGSWGGETQLGNASVDAASVENLDVAWAAGSVNVRVVDDDEADGAVQLIETAPRGLTKAQQMRWGMDGATLKVDYGSGFSCFSLSRKDLEVRLPKSCAERLGWVGIDGASGRYDVEGLSAETLELNLASGEMNVNDVRAKRLNVDVASGQLNVAGSFEQAVSLQTASGKTSVVCEDACPRSIDADVASGFMSVTVPENSGFTARVDKLSGSFASAFALTQTGDTYVCGNGEASLDVDLASGEFRLEKR